MSLMLIVVVSLMAFALVTRSYVASRVAGVERFRTTTFYAADGGINGARTRLSIGRIDGFTFNDWDLGSGHANVGGKAIEVAVSPLLLAGPPRAVVGSQIGGGQGSDSESLCAVVYRGESRASHGPTGCRSTISVALSLGPVPLSSVMSRELSLADGGGQ